MVIHPGTKIDIFSIRRVPTLKKIKKLVFFYICLFLIVREIDNKSHITKVKKRYLMDISLKSFVSNVHNIQLYIPVKKENIIYIITIIANILTNRIWLIY